MGDYVTASYRASRAICEEYGGPFWLAIQLAAPELQADLCAVCAYTQSSSQVASGLEPREQAKLVRKFKADTLAALSEETNDNPTLESLQNTLTTHEIDPELLADYLRSMEMNLIHKGYSQHGYKEYLHGSAEAIGLICLAIVCSGKTDKIADLSETAKHLSAAVQKLNWLANFAHYANDLGRVYFPDITTTTFSAQVKLGIEAEIVADLMVARAGLKRLPRSARMGVEFLYHYHNRLLKLVRATSPEQLAAGPIKLDERVALRMFSRLRLMQKLGW